MTDVTKLLENLVEPTTIEQNCVLSLIKHVWKKMKKKKYMKKIEQNYK
jgi:hypothetical protein